jgi:hypothetical protein
MWPYRVVNFVAMFVASSPILAAFVAHFVAVFRGTCHKSRNTCHKVATATTMMDERFRLNYISE